MLYLWEKIVYLFDIFLLVRRYYCRFGSNNDFILRVAPLRDKTQSYYRNYFPPPLYGTPPHKMASLSKEEKEYYKKEKYGLFLWPDYLYKDINYYTWLLLAAVLPFVFLYWYSDKTSQIYNMVYGATLLLLVLMVSLRIVFILFALFSPSVLNKVWPLWPESQYHRFLTVPHFTDIARKDHKDRKDKKHTHNPYWKPDKSSPLSHQPMYYRKGKNTLQEVMLHLAIFDFLFHQKNEIGKDEAATKSLKLRGWFYLLSPAVITYFLLLICFFISVYFYPNQLHDLCCLKDKCTITQIPALFRLPYFYTLLIIAWSLLTFKMIMRQMRFLERLRKEVREGYYDVHLELIPQQILNVVSDIPSDKQISHGIGEMEKVLRFIQAGALASFFILLEIFSSAFSV